MENQQNWVVGCWANEYGSTYCEVVFQFPEKQAIERMNSLKSNEYFRTNGREGGQVYPITQENIDEKQRNGDVWNQIAIIK